MKKKTITLLAAILAFVIALGLTLYPMIAAKYNAAHQSAIHSEYVDYVAQQDNFQLEEALAMAKEYNEALKPGVVESFSQDLLLWASEDYTDQLNIMGNGIMGYVEIPAIRVRLPIFHGTSDGTLAKGVGHLLGSSLPVGGVGTHAVLTGHSGMANQKMFSDLPNLKIGDVFFIEVLGEKLVYEVQETNVVLPYDTSLLEIDPDADLCTLVTCTPYGVNTHRLLVQGKRIDYVEPAEEETVPQETEPVASTWEQQYLKGLGIGLDVVIALGAIAIVVWFVRRKWHGEDA